MKDNNFWTIIATKPASILLLAACPALASAGDLKSGLTVGLLTLTLLFLMTLLACALKNVLAEGFRLPVFVLLAVALCAAAGMLIHAKLPQVFAAMGLYLSLLGIAVAFFAVAQLEADASFGAAVAGSLKAGLVFLAAVVLTAALCELFGSAAIWGAKLEILADMKNAVLTKPAGRLMVYGLVAALFGCAKAEKKEEAK